MSKKILVVEDQPASLRAVTYFLSREGYEVSGARDGMEAMELLERSPVDLVVSDIHMPRLDGVALATHLLSKVPFIPVIMMTGDPSANVNDILQRGVPCLSKPLALDKLSSLVETVLSYGIQSLKMLPMFLLVS
jgi:DNA-binding NtrC family response regulator